MHVRIADDNDIPAMQRIRSLVKENKLAEGRTISADMIRDFINQRGQGWVFQSDNSILGFAIADYTDHSVWALFVDPDHESQGVGKALHDHMLAEFSARRIHKVVLGTDPNTRAERFYAANGWRRTGMDDRGEVRFEIDLDSGKERGS